jgi:formate hydrogenlyase subunit 3/multisubunit Na+/H+ antiporter MnhD subunit
MCAGAIIHETGIRDLRQLGGLAGKMPVTAVACLIGALSIAGTPPLGGFASEWMIFFGGFQSGYTALAALAIIATILTAGYYLWMIKRVFFGEKPQGLEHVHEAPLTMLAPMMILTFFAVFFGIYPNAILQMFGPAAQQITQTIGGP